MMKTTQLDVIGMVEIVALKQIQIPIGMLFVKNANVLIQWGLQWACKWLSFLFMFSVIFLAQLHSSRNKILSQTNMILKSNSSSNANVQGVSK